jgi:hypothetical protein
MAINYDPAANGGAAFGNQDYDHLKSQGHSDSEINNYIGGLDTTQVSNKYKDRGGHQENDDSWKHYDDSWDGFIASAAPTQAQRDAQAKADAHTAQQAQKAAQEAKAAAEKKKAEDAKFEAGQETIKGLTANKKGPGGGTDYSDKYDTSSPNFHSSYKSLMGNYDPASRGGAAFGNEDYDYLRSQGHTESSINSYLSELDTSQVSNKYKTRGGHTPNASINSGRDSSDGLYQDRYSVGKNGADDKGDTYLSQGALGNINDYFGIKGNTQEDVVNSWNANNFEKSYTSWKDTGNSVVGKGHGGYAGDVLKMIDQNNFNVTDEQYNRLVNDAKNHNWNSQMSSDGTQAGRSHADFDASGMYDARLGGTMQSQGNMNDVTGAKYADWTNSEYYSGASVDARNNRKQQINDAIDVNVDRGSVKEGTYKHREMEGYKPEGFKYDPWATNQTGGSVRPEDVKPITGNIDPASSGGSVDKGTTNQDFTSNMFGGFSGQMKNSYKGLDMSDLQSAYTKLGFNFDPNRFNTQGQ